MQLHRCLITIVVLGGVLLSTPLARAAGSTPGDGGNAVTHWNTIATAAVLVSPGRILDSRALATVHAAIHDAVNAIDRRYQPYTADLSSPWASLDAAVAAAARDVLVTLSPGTAATTETAYQAALLLIPNGPSKEAGIALGRQCAEATLNRRASDGASAASDPPYVPTGEPGDYGFTPFNAPTPPGVIAQFPGWGRVEPWGIDLEDHPVPGPDPLQSLRYAFDLSYLKAIGSVDSAWRTSEQTEIARFWAEGAPAGWNRIANIVIRQKRLDPWKAARVLALVNFASADSFIACFDASTASDSGGRPLRFSVRTRTVILSLSRTLRGGRCSQRLLT